MSRSAFEPLARNGSRLVGSAAPLPAARQDRMAGAAAHNDLNGLQQEIDMRLGAALMMASLQADKLHELERHLGMAGTRESRLFRELHESSELLSSSLGRAVRLVRECRRLPADRSDDPVKPQPQPLASVLDFALRLPLARLADASVECRLEVAPGLQTLGSLDAWSQVLAALVANSVLHGFDGRSQGCIHIAAHPCGRDGVVRVVYSDDGVGLSAPAREHAFRRRFTSRAAQGSSGLGLCMLRDTVQTRLKGAISLLDTAAGAAFAIDVPAFTTGAAAG